MSFELDKQTLADLSIFQDSDSPDSIFNLFNHTSTLGGTELLQRMFNNPLTETAEIKQRINAIRYLQNAAGSFTPDRHLCDFVEFYLKKDSKLKGSSNFILAMERILYIFKWDNGAAYYLVQQGVTNVLSIFKFLQDFIEDTGRDEIPELLEGFHVTIKEIFGKPEFLTVKALAKKSELNYLDVAKANVLFRNDGLEDIKTLLGIVYHLDVLVTVAKTGTELNYALPEIVASESFVGLDGFFHPLIKNPVKNDIRFVQNKNLCFITGTNMAGKSTLLKSIGVCIFLSQIGFPVPAIKMQTSGFNGLITSINLSDNIFKGHSHFYNEVLRVKLVADKIYEKHKVFVIFDELFRGTNVKDAYDASLSIITAFSKVKTAFFIISTHIIEVAKILEHSEDINFQYLETTFEQSLPRCSYKLKPGINEERLGMWIIEKENIVPTIEKSIKKR